jgi:predicted TIM-barrel fold metal-dependent hydrolase
MRMRRRAFLAGAASLASVSAVSAQPAPIPIIDAHLHLADPRRPQGAPWSGPPGQPPQVALPQTYRPLAVPAGIVGAIVIEASSWIEDNLWILERAAGDPLFVGVVGRLDPSAPDFGTFLDRFSKHPLWRGIRFPRVWEQDNGRYRLRPGMADGLKLLAERGQTLDMANPSFELMRGALLALDVVPELRLVMDHMPFLDPAPDPALYESLLREAGQRPTFFIKLSQARHRNARNELVVTPRARLDALMETFGEDRVMFGTDWPNSVGTATIPQAVALMTDYFSSRPRRQAEKFFWRNSRAIYRWSARDPAQPGG